MHDSTMLRVGLAQIAPVWLNRNRTLEKIHDAMQSAAKQNCAVVGFGECLVPGYPFWIEHTDGARFESTLQKQCYAHYLEQAVCIERGDLASTCKLAKQLELAVYLGILERPLDRGGHSVYASMVYIDAQGNIESVHRKLMPTYEERLVWAIGDGHGLRTHSLRGFQLGGLNCWESWMPLARVALLAQGMNVLFIGWPGNPHNTIDITRFAAREGRSFVVSVCSLMRHSDVLAELPFSDLMRAQLPESCARGGSCVAGPDGQFVLSPQADSEDVFAVDLDLQAIQRARHNFDPVGHYARADVLQLQLNAQRQRVIKIIG
jgi:nitrilase